MNFNLESFIAFRYLKSKRDERFISVSSLFSFIGITIGVATLIIVMSVMNGFRVELLNKIIGVNGHAVLYLNQKKNIDINVLVDKIENLTEVDSVAKELEFNAMLSHKKLASGVLVKGIDKADLLERNSISNNIVKGDLENYNDKSIVVGVRLANYLGLDIDDKVTLLTSNKLDTPFGSIPVTDEFKVSAFFDVGMYDYDRNVVFLPRYEASNLLQINKDVTQLEIFFIEKYNLENAINHVNVIVGDSGKIFSWKSLHKELFSALEIERGIGILRSLGVKKSEIQRIFILVGSLVGVFGTLIGTLLGIIVSLNIAKIQIFLEDLFNSKLFSAEVYFFNVIPSDIEYTEVALIFFISIILSIISTLYPSWKASKIEPANVLRYE